MGTSIEEFFAGESNELPEILTVDAMGEVFRRFQHQIARGKKGKARVGAAMCLTAYAENECNPMVLDTLPNGSQKRRHVVDVFADNFELSKKDKSNMKGVFMSLIKRFNPQGDDLAKQAAILSRDITRGDGFRSDGTPRDGHCAVSGAAIGVTSKPEAETPKARVPNGNPAAKDTDEESDDTEKRETTLSIGVTLWNAIAILQNRVLDGDSEARSILDTLNTADLFAVDARNLNPHALVA